jgi:pyruvate dehydrogenase E2 component (dihydrolipoamide acetyltransferase)
MLKKIVMPGAGQTADHLIITKWYKSVGDRVARGEVLLEVETGKAVMPVESFAEGTLLKICFIEGDAAFTGDVLAYIGDESGLAELENTSPSALPATTDTVDDHVSESRQTKISEKGRVLLASPAAKKAARDANVRLEHICSGAGSVIRKKNVEQYLRD